MASLRRLCGRAIRVPLRCTTTHWPVYPVPITSRFFFAWVRTHLRFGSLPHSGHFTSYASASVTGMTGFGAGRVRRRRSRSARCRALADARLDRA